MINLFNQAKVVLAGAGPGDPDLITLKAHRYIKTADVIIVDRLVNQSLLDQAKLGAKILFVGKEGGNPCSFTQGSINQLIVSEANLGRLVLRLKGGDISFFSNIFSELEVLVANHIPYEIIPGVTAASGAAAYAGIPLTARGYANSVRFLACTHSELIDETKIKDIALTDDTLVLFMAAKNLHQLVNRLLENKISKEKGVAVVEQATTPNQKVLAFPVYEFLAATSNKKFKSPSIVIIGKVVNLHEQFSWFKATEEGNYFPEAQNYWTTAKVA